MGLTSPFWDGNGKNPPKKFYCYLGHKRELPKSFFFRHLGPEQKLPTQKTLPIVWEREFKVLPMGNIREQELPLKPVVHVEKKIYKFYFITREGRANFTRKSTFNNRHYCTLFINSNVGISIRFFFVPFMQLFNYEEWGFLVKEGILIWFFVVKK